ncbi:MAG: DUF397 domain-containing protein [Stackebrandtia sp.]
MTITHWRKSSRSGSDQGTCVEAAATLWRKSSRSGDNQGQCVEAAAAGERLHVRDSKLGDDSPILCMTGADWQGFLTTVRR